MSTLPLPQHTLESSRLLGIEQRRHVYRLLAAEEAKARRAFSKAQVADCHALAEFGGGSTERMATSALMQLRAAQLLAVRTFAAEYFSTHIGGAA